MSERPVPNCMDHWLKESPLPGLGSPLSQKERDWRKDIEDRLKVVEEKHLKDLYEHVDKIWNELKWKVQDEQETGN